MFVNLPIGVNIFIGLAPDVCANSTTTKFCILWEPFLFVTESGNGRGKIKQLLINIPHFIRSGQLNW